MRRISCAGSNSGMGSFHRCSSLSELPIRLATDNGKGVMDHSPMIQTGKRHCHRGLEISVIEDTGTGPRPNGLKCKGRE